MKLSTLLLATTAVAGLALACTPAMAAPAPQGGVCPAVNLVTMTSCNVEIFVSGPNSSVTINPDATPYDGNDDNLIGIINNSGSPISSLTFSGTTFAGGLFGFDGDGLASYVPSAGGDPTGYGGKTSTGQLVTFTNIDGTIDGFGDCNGACDTGTVVFGSNGIAAGGTAYFSLEGPPSLNLTPSPTPIPEPGSLLLVGTALLGLGAAWRTRRQS